MMNHGSWSQAVLPHAPSLLNSGILHPDQLKATKLHSCQRACTQTGDTPSPICHEATSLGRKNPEEDKARPHPQQEGRLRVWCPSYLYLPLGVWTNPHAASAEHLNKCARLRIMPQICSKSEMSSIACVLCPGYAGDSLSTDSTEPKIHTTKLCNITIRAIDFLKIARSLCRPHDDDAPSCTNHHSPNPRAE